MRLLSNIGLFILAVALAVVFIPLGLLYSLLTLRPCPLGSYAKACAIAIDQLGNVFCSALFNDTLIFISPSVAFGDPDQTISAVLGYNQRSGTLTFLGKGLCWVLDTIDPRHCYKAMMRDIGQHNGCP
jgi:hypothetical protein